jgi:hypothetical protein
MERKRQRELALGAILLVVLAIAAWTMRAAGRPTAGNAPAAASVPANAQNAGKTSGGAVNLEALEGARPEPEEETRNPFRFKTGSAPPRSTMPPPAQQQPSAQQAPLVAPGPPQPPPLPRIALKYIGEVGDPAKPGAKIAVLSDGRNVYHGREGDIVEGRYRIVRIGVESVDLAYLDGRGRQTIRQTGQ